MNRLYAELLGEPDAASDAAADAPGGTGSDFLGPALTAAAPLDVPPADRAELDELSRRFEADPAGVTEVLRDAWGVAGLTEGRVREAIALARGMQADPGPTVEFLSAERTALHRANPWTPEMTDRYIDARYRNPPITIDPYVHRFEDDHPAGLAGWAIFNGLPALRGFIHKRPFRWHDEQQGSQPVYRSGFTYDIVRDPAEPTLRIALFADFGTGLAHSRYIARQIEVDAPPYAIHLGDVYYTGTEKQFSDWFEALLTGVLHGERTRFLGLADNHEGYSGFGPYLDFLDHHRRRTDGFHPQEGSYFCLHTDGLQLIGLDTIWHGRGRCPGRLVDWLEARLREGRAKGRANVLLTGYQPYDYSRGAHRTDLLKADLAALAGEHLIDLWFWGNTHYCALFRRTERTPFVGSCIGHGGYPYALMSKLDDEAVPTAFLETDPRYPAETGIRQDRGNNGFCMLELLPSGTVQLVYRDWRGRVRHSARLTRTAAGHFDLSP